MPPARKGETARRACEYRLRERPQKTPSPDLRYLYRSNQPASANSDHKGLFEEDDGGILFLAEIGDIAQIVQKKLLRAIEEKQIKRLGKNRHIFCDVQIIAATSRNLPKMIQCGEFREDLYCRLAVLSIETAPLRERREDIPPMIALYMREAASAVG